MSLLHLFRLTMLAMPSGKSWQILLAVGACGSKGIPIG